MNTTELSLTNYTDFLTSSINGDLNDPLFFLCENEIMTSLQQSNSNSRK